MAPKGADKEPCSTAILRSLNVFLAAGFFVVLQQLYRRLHPRSGSEAATMMVGVLQSPAVCIDFAPVSQIWRCLHHLLWHGWH